MANNTYPPIGMRRCVAIGLTIRAFVMTKKLAILLFYF